MFLSPGSRARPRNVNPYVFIETAVASSGLIKTTQSWAPFSEIEIELINSAPSVNGNNIYLSVVISSAGLQTATYLNSAFSSPAGGALTFSAVTSPGIVLNGGNGVANTATSIVGLSGTYRFFSINTSSLKKVLTGTSAYVSGAGTITTAVSGGFWNGATNPIIGCQILSTTATANNGVTGGIANIYGVLSGI